MNEKQRGETPFTEVSRALIETAFDAFIAMNAEGLITEWNKRAESMFGWRREEIIGKPLVETIIPPQYREAHRRGLAHFLATGEGPVLNTQIELTALSRDGREFPVEIAIWPIQVDRVPVFNAFIRDITERKIAEREFARLASFANEDPNPIVELNGKGEITFLNTAAGDKFPEIFHQGLHHPLLEYVDAIWKDFLSEEKKIVTREIHIGKDAYQQRIVAFDRGERVCVYFNDVTALKRAHEQLKSYQNQLIESEKATLLGRVAGGVAHEIKNPLAILTQGMDYLSRQTGQDPNIASVLKDMNDAIERTDYAVRGLLDLSRPRQLFLEPDNLNSIIEACLLLVKNQADHHRIRIKKDLQPELAKFCADRGRMQHVFINLFMNAIEAMADTGEGELNIRTYAKKLEAVGFRVGRRKEDIFRVGQEVLVAEVYDTGPGIQEEVLQKVFDPFFTTKRGRGGTGLGLAVVKNIVEIHQGMVRIENRPEGGVRVVVMLPSLGRKGEE